ncbi:MAG: type II 3-dehydroquinate dehydratase [Alphaproteobacteria bacterium]|nr:type II 3-dehydroquinate dehydratase [Alphaproteobacteria bacterium]
MAETTTVFVLNGPNLNLLGTREPGIYGRETLADVEALCRRTAGPIGLRIDFRQTNHEGVLVDWVQEAAGQAGGIVLNAAGYTHTSVALLDALNAFAGPVIEVHVSNVYGREAFRHHSYVSARADGVLCGVGLAGYALALAAIAPLLDAPPADRSVRT